MTPPDYQESSVSESTIIGAWVKDPREPGLFSKGSKTEPAKCRVLTCKQTDCPLRAKQQCVMVRGFGCRCPYGEYRTQSGPTGRSGKIYGWLSEKREEFKDYDWPKSPPDKLTFIGDYVYLPYAHMSMMKDGPFVDPSFAFYAGSPFIKREAWTLATVLMLIDFRPQALFGGEISDYQRKSVPAFISHIREVDPEMWQQLIAERPQYDTTPNYVGRKALVKTLAYPIRIPAYHAEYPVSWEWDGVHLTTNSEHAYGSTWGHIKPGRFEAKIVPDDKSEVTVADNSWVTPDTVFVD